MTEDKSILWLWLSCKCSPGAKYSNIILDAFGGSVEDIFNANEEDYGNIPKINKAFAKNLLDKSLSKAKKIYSFCQNEGIGLLFPDSALYPARLGRIIDKPVVLYYKGKLRDLESELCIAEVGTRTITEYGSQAAYSIAYDLAKSGAVVVSGMAKGIDSMAHRGAIDAGGYTVAVLGNGIERAYPDENLPLMNEIIKNGLVISEYRPFTPPNGYNFPIRNRIISGLSQGTVVVEAPLSSGAMITAKAANEQGRDIFAVPGKVGEMNSVGTNQLIKNGSKIVTCAADILFEYQPLYGNKINLNNIPSIKSKIYKSPIASKAASPRPSFSNKPFEERVRKQAIERSYAVVKTNDSDNIKTEIYKFPENNGEICFKRDYSGFPDDQRRILMSFTDKLQMTSDEITARTELPIDKVLVALTMLEISGDISALPGGLYTINQK